MIQIKMGIRRHPRNSRSKLLNPFSGLDALRLRLATAILTPPPLTVR